MTESIKHVKIKLKLPEGAEDIFKEGAWLSWVDEIESNIRAKHGKVANYFLKGTKYKPKRPEPTDYLLVAEDGEIPFTPGEQSK
jgi:hypothetical protein